MVEIYDVNQASIFDYADHNSLISFLVQDFSDSQNISESQVFVLNSKGVICEEYSKVAECVDDEANFLLVFRKDKFELGFPVVKKDWKAFNEFPPMNWKAQSFEFSLYESKDFDGTIKTYENLLYKLNINARNAYAKFRTSSEYLRNSDTAVKCQLFASKAMIGMSKDYYTGVTGLWEELSADFTRFKADIKPKALEFSSKFLKIPDVELKNQLKSLKFSGFVEALLGNLQKLEEKILKLKEILSTFDSEVEEMEISLNRLELGAENTLKDLNNSNGLNQEPLFIENFFVCTQYFSFQEDLNKLTDFNYHPKTPIVAKLGGSAIGEEIESFRCNATSLEAWLQELDKCEQKLSKTVKSVSTFYRKYANFVINKVKIVKYMVKGKIDKYTNRLKRLKEKARLLELPEVMIRFQAEISDHCKKPENNNIEKLVNGLYCKILRNQDQNKRFFSEYGSVLPFKSYKSLLASFNINNIIVESESCTNKPLFNSSIENLDVKNAEYFYNKVSIQAIHKYYKEQMKLQEESYQALMKSLERECEGLENDIEAKNNEIFEIIEERMRVEESLINMHKEIEIIESGDSLGRARNEIEILMSRSKNYRKRKMKEIERLRLENQKLLSASIANFDF